MIKFYLTSIENGKWQMKEGEIQRFFIFLLFFE